MKYSKFFLAVLLAGLPVGCWAQDDVTYATDALQEVLSHLKQSVEQLTADNQRLTLQNNAVKQDIEQWQAQLGQLRQQEDLLNKTAARLRSDNPRRAQQISRLQEESLDLDNRTQKTLEAIKSLQGALQAGYQEREQLLRQMNDMQGLPSSPNAESPLEARRQKEKLQLMKMIYDSQARQESLHASILDYEKQTPVPSAAGLLAYQQVLKEQIKDLEGQIVTSPSSQWDDTQLGALELELRKLEQNYTQLKNLLKQMGPKFPRTQMTGSQHAEQGQLEGSVNDLKRQEAGLKADLDDLRSQMVVLDKRKSSLEMLIKQQP